MSQYLLGNEVVWSQSSDENDKSLEITIPVVLPAGVRTKELTVVVKDAEVLCVKYKESSLVQWRLYSKVSEDVEWRAESSNIVVDLVKADGATWPCLLNLPMRPDDSLFTTPAELDNLFAKEVKALPPVKESDIVAPSGGAIDEEDLDRLLEETVQEVQELDVYVKAELKGMEEEEMEMKSKLKELEEALSSSTMDDESSETTKKQMQLVEKMLEVHHQTRKLRSLPCTVATFLETQNLDLRKARINVGELSESESEAFMNDEERNMSAHELFAIGVRALQEQQIEAALHFLRLAAVHHKHSQSVSILFRLYTELGSPRGAYLLLQRAKDEDGGDIDVSANLQVAEMFDRGARHFPPILGAAIYFYQRAARSGSVHAMIGLAQLFLRGSTTATTLNEEERATNVDMKKYHGWLEQAIGRGSGAALFIKGCMHLRGEHGCEKSYRIAKDFLDRSGKCQPEIMKRSVGVNAALDKLRIEEEAANGGSGPEAKSPLTPSSPPASPSTGASSTVATRSAPAPPKVDVAARLAALEQQSGAAAIPERRAAPGKKTSTSHAAASARSRAMWERATITGTAVCAIYTLAFPLRVIFLPHFYTVIQWFLDAFGLGGGSMIEARGLM